MKAMSVAALLFMLLAAAAPPLAAHHSWPVDFQHLVTVKGTVVDFQWTNPHPMMTIEVQADNGRKERWVIGGPAINRMEANGWSKNTVKPGDPVTGVGFQFSDGQKIIRLEKVILGDGKEMRVYGR